MKRMKMTVKGGMARRAQGTSWRGSWPFGLRLESLEARRVLTFKPSLVLKNLLNEDGVAEREAAPSEGSELGNRAGGSF